MSAKFWNNDNNAGSLLGLSKDASSAIIGGVGALGSTFGNVMASSGWQKNGTGQVLDTLGSVASAIPGPWGAIAGTGLKLFSNLFSSKINQENVNKLQGQINNANNFQASAGDNDAYMAQLGSLPSVENFSKSDIGSDGLFSHKASRLYRQMKDKAEKANSFVGHSLDNNLSNIEYNNMFNLLSNYAALGGNLYPFGGSTHGTIFDTPLMEINAGSTHENNPNTGVQMGVDAQGIPNYVEEGETILNGDYVFSDRMKVPKNKETRKQLGLPKKKDMTFADASKEINKEAKERPNDPISKAGVQVALDNLAVVQEEERQKEMIKELMNNPEMLQALLAQASQQPQQMGQPAMAAYGGDIHIDKNKRGTFTVAASKHGMGVQEFASKVLANKDDYSPAMVKKANFARNAAKWHALGGNLFLLGGPKINANNTSGNYGDSLLEFFNIKSSNAVNGNTVKGKAKNEARKAARKARASSSAITPPQPQLVDPVEKPTKLDYMNLSPEQLGVTQDEYNWWKGLTDYQRILAGNYYYPGETGSRDWANSALYNPDVQEGRHILSWASLNPDGQDNPEGPNLAVKRAYANRDSKTGNVVVPKDSPITTMPSIQFKNNRNLATEFPSPILTPEQQSSVSKGVDTKSMAGGKTQSEPYYDKMAWLRYAPALGATIATITDALGLTNKPDYSNAERVEEASKGIRDIKWNPIGNYLTYKPYDINYALTKTASAAAANRRALANAGRSGLAASILAADNNYLNSIGQTYADALNYNAKQLAAVEDFNRNTNLANSEGFLKADSMNTTNDYHRLNSIYQAAMMRQHERDAANASRAANFKDTLNSWGNIGREAYTANQINNMRNLRYRTNPYIGTSWYDAIYE